ncbi:MAG: PrsW family glutamic-type intramembrane protease [Abditibacteriales bacterium]|nr:PrsW family glutamic-type intramembrane protease [Abditibacteriales bacterium]MDW8366971.1 PrsW family glutamic-type intramembrane protease [Abditibacteriales bacterium]
MLTPSTILCPACQSPSPVGRQKCAACGASLVVVPCPRCGQENELSAPLCSRCYADLRLRRCPHCHAPNLLSAVVCAQCRRELIVSRQTGGERIAPSPGKRGGNLWNVLVVLFNGGVLAGVLLVFLRHNPSPALAIAAAIAGSFLVPATATLALWEIWARRQIPGTTFFCVFVSGAVLGTAASLVLYVVIPLVGVGFGGLLAVPVIIGAAEELGKMLSVGWLLKRQEYALETHGFMFGIAAGLGFAALESMGYALIGYHLGGVPRMTQVVLLRAFLTTFVHAAWTGSLAAIVWRERRISVQFTPPVLATYVLVAVLHAVWDYHIMPGVPLDEGIAFLVISGLCTVALFILRAQSAVLAARRK